MNITYKIVAADRSVGQIQVAYFQGEKMLGSWAIDVPVADGSFLTTEALDAEIMHRAPSWAVEREQQVATATGFDQIVALVQPLPVNEPTSEQQANAAMWAQVDYEKKLAKALVKFGVLSSDPTSIETTQL